MSSTSRQMTSLKITIIGNASTGKSCLLRRYIDDVFSEETVSTVGVEFGAKVVTLDGERVKLQVWDCAGHDRYFSVSRSYMRGATGALLVYDVTNHRSFEDVPRWLNEIKQLAGPDVVIMLIGNKTDLCQGAANSDRREVPHTEASVFAQENGIMHMETSAATGDFVPEAFLRVAREALKHQRQQSGGGRGGSGGGGAGAGGQKSRLLNNQDGADDDDEGNAPHLAAGGGGGSRAVRLDAESAQQRGGAGAEEDGGMCGKC